MPLKSVGPCPDFAVDVVPRGRQCEGKGADGREWKVELQQFPQEACNTSVVVAAVAGKLPDILDVDGPVMPNRAWSKYLQPLAHNIRIPTLDKPWTKAEFDAALEGASKWQVFRYVTWPGLRNTAILVMVVITMQAFTLYPQIDVMT